MVCALKFLRNYRIFLLEIINNRLKIIIGIVLLLILDLGDLILKIRHDYFNLFLVLLVLHNFSVFDLLDKLNNIFREPIVLITQLKEEIHKSDVVLLGVLIHLKVDPIFLVGFNETLLNKRLLIVPHLSRNFI